MSKVLLHVLCVLMLLIALVPNQSSQASDTAPAPLKWHRLEDMPAGVFSAASSVTGRDVVITGGLNQAGQASTLIQVFNLDTLKWRVASIEIPVGVAYHSQLTLRDGRILVTGGKTGSLMHGLKTTAMTWIISADLQSLTRGPDLPAPADNHTTHLLPTDQAIIIAGKHATLFDPDTLQFTYRIELRESRREHASVLLPGGRILVAGGISRRSLEMVDVPRRISTMLSARLPVPTDDLAASVLPDGRVLIIGGQDSHKGNTLDECYVVDLSNPNQTTLTPAPSLGVPGGAADHVIARLGQWIVVAGGESQQNNEDVELSAARIIDSQSLKVWSLPDMIVAHDDAQIVTDDRSVIVIGGYSVSTLSIGPLVTKMPTAVHVVERLILPEHRFMEDK